MGGSLERLNPPSLPDAAGLGYSQVTTVESGRLAFVSGQVAWRPGGEAVPDSLVGQARLVVTNARAALDAAGASPEDLVMVRVYMVNLTPERLDELMPVLLEWFDGSRPSVTGVGVVALAAPELQLEVELIASLS